MSTIVYDIEVAFYPEITEMAMARGVDEKQFSETRFGNKIDANMRYITHISYKIDNKPVVDLSLLDGKGGLKGDHNEKNLLERFREAYNNCDESVAHYGSRFDIRFLNSRMMRHGLPRLKPIKLHDTWVIMKTHFSEITNRLDSAIVAFKCPYGKPSIPWSVWRRVSLGEERAHKILRHRCRYDVLSLSWLWKHVFSKFANRANQALKYERPYLNDGAVRVQVAKARCPKCGVKGLLKREGYYDTKVSTVQQLSCRKCFEWSHAPIKKDGTLGRIR